MADLFNNRIRKLSTVGIGEIVVTWSAAAKPGTPVTYAASAAARGRKPQTCTTTGTSCTIGGLLSGVAYEVSVSGTNAAGTSLASAVTTATPN